MTNIIDTITAFAEKQNAQHLEDTLQMLFAGGLQPAGESLGNAVKTTPSYWAQRGTKTWGMLEMLGYLHHDFDNGILVCEAWADEALPVGDNEEVLCAYSDAELERRLSEGETFEKTGDKSGCWTNANFIVDGPDATFVPLGGNAFCKKLEVLVLRFDGTGTVQTTEGPALYAPDKIVLLEKNKKSSILVPYVIEEEYLKNYKFL